MTDSDHGRAEHYRSVQQRLGCLVTAMDSVKKSRDNVQEARDMMDTAGNPSGCRRKTKVVGKCLKKGIAAAALETESAKRHSRTRSARRKVPKNEKKALTLRIVIERSCNLSATCWHQWLWPCHEMNWEIPGVTMAASRPFLLKAPLTKMKKR